MTNIPLIVHLGDGCVIVGKLVTFEQTLLMPPVPGCPIIKLPEASCRVSILTNTMGILDLNARHIVKIGTDKVEGSVEQLLLQICQDAST